MKRINILQKNQEDITSIREDAKARNLYNNVAESTLKDLRSPINSNKYILIDNYLISSENDKVSIVNGVPDFTVYSYSALDQKNQQAEYHDNEEINETFEEIVLRPFNYNKLHAKIWINHLYRVGKNIEKVLNKNLKNLTVLNCGCGGGFEAEFFALQGAKITGFDISKLRVEAAATRFALNNLDGFFYRGDASVLPFPDNTFDIVLYHDSLHHVPIEDIPIAVREACRVCKTGVVFVEANDSIFRILLEYLGLSLSIEASGNYTFRFKKSLMLFWAKRNNMELLLYRKIFSKKEHRPKLFKNDYLGSMIYFILKFIGYFLNFDGNEAIIIMKKLK